MDAPARQEGIFPYRVVPGWGLDALSDGLGGWEVADVATAKGGQEVHLLVRDPSRVVVLSTDGELVRVWGDGMFSRRPHGITVAPDGTTYIVDQPAHVVRIFDADDKPVRTIGNEGHPSDTGVDISLPVPAWTATVARAAAPFNNPTKVAVVPGGGFLVADGYGNARIHRFDAEGELLSSWGLPGTGSGEFKLPHSVLVLRDGTVLVADRENDRLQQFTVDGVHLASWNDVRRPTALAETSDGRILVGQLPWRKGEVAHRLGLVREETPARLSLISANGSVLGWRENRASAAAPGRFVAPHGLAADIHDDIYVAEVSHTFTQNEQPFTIQKFALQGRE
jgi:sugar lactone lactonase YvrE